VPAVIFANRDLQNFSGISFRDIPSLPLKNISISLTSNPITDQRTWTKRFGRKIEGTWLSLVNLLFQRVNDIEEFIYTPKSKKPTKNNHRLWLTSLWNPG
jgi:hypothetical protein